VQVTYECRRGGGDSWGFLRSGLFAFWGGGRDEWGGGGGVSCECLSSRLIAFMGSRKGRLVGECIGIVRRELLFPYRDKCLQSVYK